MIEYQDVSPSVKRRWWRRTVCLKAPRVGSTDEVIDKEPLTYVYTTRVHSQDISSSTRPPSSHSAFGHPPTSR